MKVIKIQVEGFGSIHKLKYKFDRPGLNLILGENGVGKTTIFNALSWCLYGELLKKGSSINPWPNIMHKDYKGTMVRCQCSDGVEIIRCNEYTGKVEGVKGKNRLIILENGKEVKTNRDKKDGQKWINVFVGYSFQLFKNSVLFGQELKRLLQEDGPTKKKTFDEAFESAFINRARDYAQITLTQLDKEKVEITTKLESQRSLLTNNRQLLREITEARKTFGIKKATEVAGIRKGIRELAAELRETKVQATGQRGMGEHLHGIQLKLEEIKAKINNKADDLEFRKMLEITNLGEQVETLLLEKKKLRGQLRKSNICPTCKQPLNPTKRQELRVNLKGQLAKNLENRNIIKNQLKLARNEQQAALEEIKWNSEYKTLINKLELEEKAIHDRLLIIADYRHKGKILKARIKEKKIYINEVRKRKLETNDTSIIENIKRFKKNIELLGVQEAKIQKKINVQNWLITDPLANSGLKAYIFDSMLNKVNYFLKQYTKHIGMSMKVYMNLESHNKDFCISVYKGEQEIPYEDLSKGQKQLAEVVLCFAINDVVGMQKPINILLMDEIFESLSENNVEIVANIVIQKARNRSIHLITHQSSFNPPSSYKVFIKLNEQNQTVVDQKYQVT